MENKKFIIGAVALVVLIASLILLFSAEQSPQTKTEYSKELKPAWEEQGLEQELFHENIESIYYLENEKLNEIRNNFTKLKITTNNEFHKKLADIYINIIDLIKTSDQLEKKDKVLIEKEFECNTIQLREERIQTNQTFLKQITKIQEKIIELNKQFPSKAKELNMNNFDFTNTELNQLIEDENNSIQTLKEFCQ